MMDLWVSECCRCDHDGVDDAKGDGILLFDRWVFNTIYFNLKYEALVQSGVILSVWGFSWVEEDIHEAGHRNLPPFLRNRLFLKSVQASLGVLNIKDSVSVHLDYLN